MRAFRGIACLVGLVIMVFSAQYMVHLKHQIAECRCHIQRCECEMERQEKQINRQEEYIDDIVRCCSQLCDVVNGANENGRCMGKAPIKAPGK